MLSFQLQGNRNIMNSLETFMRGEYAREIERDRESLLSRQIHIFSFEDGEVLHERRLLIMHGKCSI